MSVKKYTDATGVAEIWAKVKSIIPSKTSDLTNDSSFITLNDVPTEVYWATYGTTTSTQIDSALSSEKIVAILSSNGNRVFYLSTINTGSSTKNYRFSRTDLNAVFTYELQVNLSTGTETWYSVSNTMLTKSGILDTFYPIGSYYETSDTSFDPNTSWGGTWILETEGQVHVSAGTNYTIAGALTNTSDDGTTDAIIPYHNHGFTNPQYQATGGAVTDKAAFNTANNATGTSITGGGHTHTSFRYESKKLGSGTLGSRIYQPSTSGSYTDAKTSSDTHTHTLPQHVHSVPQHGHGFTQPTISLKSGGGGSVAYAGTDGNTANANMQPYIVVNRWHRTA